MATPVLVALMALACLVTAEDNATSPTTVQDIVTTTVAAVTTTTANSSGGGDKPTTTLATVTVTPYRLTYDPAEQPYLLTVSKSFTLKIEWSSPEEQVTTATVSDSDCSLQLGALTSTQNQAELEVDAGSRVGHVTLAFSSENGTRVGEYEVSVTREYGRQESWQSVSYVMAGLGFVLMAMAGCSVDWRFDIKRMPSWLVLILVLATILVPVVSTLIRAVVVCVYRILIGYIYIYVTSRYLFINLCI